MKAFTFYSSKEFDLRYLLKKLQDYGEVNCDLETFSKLYKEWCANTFPGIPENNVMSMIFEKDWLENFILYLANKDI